jgi:uncharacterized protein (TIGR00369 family)
MTTQVSAQALQRFLDEEFPQSSISVERVDEEGVWVRQPVDVAHLRPGGTVSGPTMMATADCAAYVVILSRIGIVPLAVTTNLTINFLRKPSADRTITARATLLKLGRRLALSEVNLYSEGEPAPVAHAVVTYAIPERSEGVQR